MFLDVPFGDFSNPEYISLYFGVDRKTKTPISFEVRVPGDADPEAGVWIAFWNLKEGKEGMEPNYSMEPVRMVFEFCDIESCAAFAKNAILQSENGEAINILENLKEGGSLWVLFMRNGESKRVMLPVFLFKEKYESLLENELSHPDTSVLWLIQDLTTAVS